MVQFLYANSADIAVAGPGRPVDVTSHTEFVRIDLESIRYDVGDLYVALDVLVFWDHEEIIVHFVFLVLGYSMLTIF